jgi:hypothetical protein
VEGSIAGPSVVGFGNNCRASVEDDTAVFVAVDDDGDDDEDEGKEGFAAVDVVGELAGEAPLSLILAASEDLISSNSCSGIFISGGSKDAKS